MSTSKAPSIKRIAENRKARHEYLLSTQWEAGLVLQGWEIKSLRAGKANIADSYVLLKDQEAWLLGSQIVPLTSASTHIQAEPTRTRKLLLHKKELKTLIGATQRKGFTVVPLTLYWKNHRVKITVALAKGKKLHDKRETEKERDWLREKQRLKSFKNI